MDERVRLRRVGGENHMRADGDIDDDVLRKLERELDQEQRGQA
jgi:hypothetical protein